MPKKANIGDTVRTKSGDVFVVLNEKVDENGVQYVYKCDCGETHTIDCILSFNSHGIPDKKFEVIKKVGNE